MIRSTFQRSASVQTSLSQGNSVRRWACCTWRLVALALATMLSLSTHAAEPDKPPRRDLLIPVEELDALLEGSADDRRAVLLPRAEYERLSNLAKERAPLAGPASTEGELVQAEWRGEATDQHVRLTISAEFRQFHDGWKAWTLPVKGLSILSAAVQTDDGDEQPARLARGDGVLQLFTRGAGTHRLKLTAATPMFLSASDQLATCSLWPSPAARFHISVPAGKRLILGTTSPPRPAPLSQPAEYAVPVGGLAELKLRITDGAPSASNESLAFASIGYGVRVEPGEANWQALCQLQVFGRPIDRLVCSVPSILEIADVDAIGLQSWELADDPTQPNRTLLRLTFSQSFDGSRKILFRGVAPAPQGESWAVPPLRVHEIASQIGAVLITHPVAVRLRIDETAGVRRTGLDGAAESGLPDDMGVINPTTSLRFAAYVPDFVLRLAAVPRPRELHTAVATVVDASPQALELVSSVTLETRHAPLFEVDVQLPAEWSLSVAMCQNLPLRWQLIPDDAGVRRYRITLNQPLAKDAGTMISLKARRELDQAALETAAGADVALPELVVPDASITETAIVVTASPELDVLPGTLTGLDLGAPKPNERLRFQAQDSRYAGQLTVRRQPHRFSAQTIASFRLERNTWRLRWQGRIRVTSGRVGELSIEAPDSLGDDARFVPLNGPVVSEQKSEPIGGGQRRWTLKFLDRVADGVWLSLEVTRGRLELPRAETRVPELRIVGAELQDGFVVVEAEDDQQLFVTAANANGEALAELDPLQFTASTGLQPLSRVAGIYRTIHAGDAVSVRDERLGKAALPSAIAAEATGVSVISRAGELQEQADFRFHVAGGQGLSMTLPRNAELWSVQLNDQPAEARRLATKSDPTGTAAPSNSALFVPLTAGQNGQMEQRLRVVWRKARPADGPRSGYQPELPQVRVVSGGGDVLPMELLSQKWTLRYPRDLDLVASRGAFAPVEPLDEPGWLRRQWRRWSAPASSTLLVRLAILVALAALVAIVRRITRGDAFTTGKSIAVAVAAIGVCCICVAPLLLFTSGPLVLPKADRSTVATSSGPAGAVRFSVTDGETSAPEVVAAPESASTATLGDEFSIRSRQSGEKDAASPFAKEEERVEQRFSREPVMAGRKSAIANGLSDAPAPAATPQAALPQQAPASPQEDRSGRWDQTQKGLELAQQVDGEGQRPAKPARPEFKRRNAPSGRLSLAMQVDASQSPREKHFVYHGRKTDSVSLGGWTLELIDQSSADALRYTVSLLVLLACWIGQTWTAGSRSAISAPTVRRRSIGVAGTIVALAAGLALWFPTRWGVLLDGLVLGGVVSLALLVASVICRRLIAWTRDVIHRRSTPGAPTDAVSVAGLTFLVVTLGAVASTDAQEPAPSRGAVTPYVDADSITAADRVFLPLKEYLALRRRAGLDPEPIVDGPASGLVAEANYACRLLPAVPGQPRSVAVEARYLIRLDGPGVRAVSLPLGMVAVDAARHTGPDGASSTDALLAWKDGGWQTMLSRPGLHAVDVRFTVPAEANGANGQFSLPLKPVVAGSLSFALPAPGLDVRFPNVPVVYRRVAHDAGESIDVPIDQAEHLTLVWRPAGAKAAVGAVVHVDSTLSMNLSDAGLLYTAAFAYRVRQGAVAEAIVAVPDGLRLKTITGPDVGGWGWHPEANGRQLRIALRRPVDDETRFTIELFAEARPEQAGEPTVVPQIQPMQITHETGVVGVFAEPQFQVRHESAANASQLEPNRFQPNLPDMRPDALPLLAYRFAQRPFAVSIRSTRSLATARAVVQHGVLIAERKRTISTRVVYQLLGAARGSVVVLLPDGYVPLRVQTPGLHDYYLLKEGGANRLVVELDGPKQGELIVSLQGVLAHDPRAESIDVPFPVPEGADGGTTEAAVWIDPLFAYSVKSSAGWFAVESKSLDPTLASLRAQPPSLAFRRPTVQSTPLEFHLKRGKSRVRGVSLTTATVADVTVGFSIAMQWQIDQAPADSLGFTTPAEFAGKLNFHGDQVRDVQSRIVGDRAEWNVSLRQPVHGRYFGVAQIDLPPAADDVAAPSLRLTAGGVPVEDEQQFVLLVNISGAQLANRTPELGDSVTAEELPIKAPPELVRQGVELLRLKTPGAAPAWSLRRSVQNLGAPASVNLVDLETQLAPDGSYRGVAKFFVKNRSRQFLALRLPTGMEPLSTFVANHPARGVIGDVAGKPAYLVALPKTSAVDRAVVVSVAFAGQLDAPLPGGFRWVALELSIPGPEVVSLQESPEFGIPVAQSRWTVRLPKDLQARPSRSIGKHNLNSIDAGADDAVGQAILSEFNDIYRATTSERNEFARSRGMDNLRQLRQSLQEIRAKNEVRGRSKSQSFGLHNWEEQADEALGRLQQAPQADAAAKQANGGVAVFDEAAQYGFNFANGNLLFNLNRDGPVQADDAAGVEFFFTAPQSGKRELGEVLGKTSGGVGAVDARRRYQMSNTAELEKLAEQQLRAHVANDRKWMATTRGDAQVPQAQSFGGGAITGAMPPVGGDDGVAGWGGITQPLVVPGFLVNPGPMNANQAGAPGNRSSNRGDVNQPMSGDGTLPYAGGPHQYHDFSLFADGNGRSMQSGAALSANVPLGALDMDSDGIAPLDAARVMAGEPVAVARPGRGLSLPVELPHDGDSLAFSKTAGDARLTLQFTHRGVREAGARFAAAVALFLVAALWWYALARTEWDRRTTCGLMVAAAVAALFLLPGAWFAIPLLALAPLVWRLSKPAPRDEPASPSPAAS